MTNRLGQAPACEAHMPTQPPTHRRACPPPADIKALSWSRAPRGFMLAVERAEKGSTLLFIGFKDSKDLDSIKAVHAGEVKVPDRLVVSCLVVVLCRAMRKRRHRAGGTLSGRILPGAGGNRPRQPPHPQDEPAPVSGRNWGGLDIDGSTLVFRVAGAPALRVPLPELSGAQQGKDDVLIELPADDTTAGVPCAAVHFAPCAARCAPLAACCDRRVAAECSAAQRRPRPPLGGRPLLGGGLGPTARLSRNPTLMAPKELRALATTRMSWLSSPDPS